jgi:hypothetical protein
MPCRTISWRKSVATCNSRKPREQTASVRGSKPEPGGYRGCGRQGGRHAVRIIPDAISQEAHDGRCLPNRLEGLLSCR